MQGVGNGLLLSEQAHRVANDMAVAVAAMRLAERRSGGDADIAAAIARIEATVTVQRMLCARPVGATVDLGQLLRRLCAAMEAAHPLPDCSIDVACPLVAVGDVVAMSIAMCVHELARNALVHACRRGGRVLVEVSEDCGSLTIAVADRGPARTWGRAGGQGAAIVDELAEAIGGAVSRRVTPAGGRVEVALPDVAAATSALLEV